MKNIFLFCLLLLSELVFSQGNISNIDKSIKDTISSSNKKLAAEKELQNLHMQKINSNTRITTDFENRMQKLISEKEIKIKNLPIDNYTSNKNVIMNEYSSQISNLKSQRDNKLLDNEKFWNEKIFKVKEVMGVVEEKNEEVKIEDEQVFVVVEEKPEFPGGELALQAFIGKAIVYPAVAQKNGIQGKVFVTFVVNKNGSVSNAKIDRGVDASLDAEALRVVLTLPQWKPGKQSGVPVRVSYTVPIRFKLP